MRRHQLTGLCINIGALAALTGYILGYPLLPLEPLIPISMFSNALMSARRRDLWGATYLLTSATCLAGAAVTVYWAAGARFSPQIYLPNPAWIFLNRAMVYAIPTLGCLLFLQPQGRKLPSLSTLYLLPFYGAAALAALVFISPELMPGLDMYVASFAFFVGTILLKLLTFAACVSKECKKRAALLVLAALAGGIFHLPLAGAGLALDLGSRTLYTPAVKPSLSMPAYYLGLSHQPCEMVVHQPFFVSPALKLHYDAFLPVDRNHQLPVIVRLHGGGWMGGNKGDANRVQLSKHLATQGYAVFDIQYGLNHRLRLQPVVRAPGYLSGNYSIDDMVSHVGLFLEYLSRRQGELGIDLSRVVLFGNSAGGQLGMAAGLALSEGKFTDIISAPVTIRGIVACYPANGLSDTLGVPGTKELVWPETMVSSASPSLLLLHGTHDAMAPISISIRIRDRYLDAGNSNAYLLVLPLAGHSPDLHYSGVYNQVWLHFLDGFLANIMK